MNEVNLAVARVSRDACPVTLHLMVKNGASVVGRLLDCVGPHVRGLVAVLNDCTDDTAAVLADRCKVHGLTCELVTVTREGHPHLYHLDVPLVYQVGEPFAGEVFPGPFTGEFLLSDWSGARNVGWSRSSCDWKLFLDADDVVDDPEVVPGLCLALQARDIEVAASRYHYHRSERGDWRADAHRERLARNFPGIRWRDYVHEVLTGYDPARVAQVEGSLVVRDLRDTKGTGTRPPGRNLKVLYRRARQVGWQLTQRETVYLAAEAQQPMPELCVALVEKYLRGAVWPEEAGWACTLVGEVREHDDHLKKACEWYERSLTYHPGSLAAFRLARARFQMKEWQEALDAYELGVKNAANVQLLDSGTVQVDQTAILAVVCHEKLGNMDKAKELCRRLLARFPENKALRELALALGVLL